MKIALAAVAAMLVGAPAMATVWTTDYTFTATFDQGPYATLSGSFSIESDDVAETNKLTTFDLSIGDYVYSTSNASLKTGGAAPYHGYLLIGGNSNGVNMLAGYTNDLALMINIYAPPLAALDYTIPSYLGAYYGRLVYNAVGSGPYIPPGPPSTPEPATWATMLLGFGAIGLGTRRRVKARVTRA